MSYYQNLLHRDRDKYIYRIMPIDRVCNLFETGENVLVNPRKWDDPFESVVLRSVFPRVGLFGQCWTRHTASDAMWRIYSPQSRGVRIRTTVRALVTSLSRTVAGASAHAFIGGVKYLPERDLIDFVTNLLSHESLQDPSQKARTLLVKRLAFRHEREVRLLLVNRRDSRDQDTFAYRMNPHKLVDQIMLDPRLTNDEADPLRETIRQRTQFQGPILRSLLYTLPTQLSRFAQTGKPSD